MTNIKEVMSKMSVSILKGLTEEEAAILAGLSMNEFKELKNNSQIFSEFLLKKRIEFKEKHLQIIDEKKDPKTSQWLLEKLRVKEFGPTRVGQGATSINIIGSIIKEVQDDDKANGLVKADSGILTVTKTGEKKELPKSIKDVLA